MKPRSLTLSTLYFQALAILICLGLLGFILYEPQIEGRNADATFFEIYFNDSFLVYAYSSSTLIFVVLYQIYKNIRIYST